MGHQKWLLAHGLQGRGGVKLCVRAPTGAKQTNKASNPNIPPNGVGGIATIFLRCNGDCKGHRIGLL